jgi:hypothetical protein
LSKNQLIIMIRPVRGNSHLQGYLFKMGMVDNREWERCKKALETAYALCGCEAMVAPVTIS